MHDVLKALADKSQRLIAGVMSGTSFDGVDVAFVEVSGFGESVETNLKWFRTMPFDEGIKTDLLANSAKNGGSVADICRLNKHLGVLIGEAVVTAARMGKIDMRQVDFVASHGLTLYHMPEISATMQIGELADIAAVTGKIVVGDFRPSDTAHDGQGAPLVPYADYVLYRSKTANRVLFNVGGIGNVTILPANCAARDVLAFDTGPGNVLMDNLVRLWTGGTKHFDDNGSMAQKGRQITELAEYLINIDSFIPVAPPKSTGRELYTMAMAENVMRRGKELGLPFADILATTANHTAYALHYALTNFVDTEPDEILITGGGAKNACLLERLRGHYPSRIKTIESDASDAKEAVAFAILGNEFIAGRPNNLPSATGARRPVIMGKLVLP